MLYAVLYALYAPRRLVVPVVPEACSLYTPRPPLAGDGYGSILRRRVVDTLTLKRNSWPSSEFGSFNVNKYTPADDPLNSSSHPSANMHVLSL